MDHRNRAGGWKYAKLTGHENENLVEKLIKSDIEYQEYFLKRIGKTNSKIIDVSAGGLKEKNVPCIFCGETTKSKTDMQIMLDDDSCLNVSIKKSTSGQVYLISDSRFINGFEFQYKKEIPPRIKEAIKLFWGSSENTLQILNKFGTQLEYEKRKNRLVGDTLKRYNSKLYEDLILWFQSNIYEITDFCFSKGLAANKNDWAEIIWYKNELGENSIDDIFYIKDLCNIMQQKSNIEIFYGNKGGGTTIQLPFGFVQWHSPTKKIPGDMQFHHNYEKILKLVRCVR